MRRRQNLVDEFTPGKIYRFYGAYKTQGDVTAQIVISNDLDGLGGDSIFEDGRTVDLDTKHFIDLSGTGGEYRRFAIDFIAFDTTHEFLIRAVSGGGAGEVFFIDSEKIAELYQARRDGVGAMITLYNEWGVGINKRHLL